jgi:opacity protein-like surface antigen
MSYKQQFAFAVLLALGALAAPVAAQAPLATATNASATDAGFYGGVVLRQGPQEGPGVQIGNFTSAWSKFVAPTADETASRALLFGGYRWANDLALEAAFATVDRYALAPSGRGGVGLALGSSAEGAGVRSWNADVYTSWAFRKSFALYGRLGYVQSDAQLAYAPATFLAADPRRPRDGMNYGVGLRYDVTRTLGLRLEYARFGRFAGESVNGLLPESDQVQFGMQFRF